MECRKVRNNNLIALYGSTNSSCRTSTSSFLSLIVITSDNQFGVAAAAVFATSQHASELIRLGHRRALEYQWKVT